MNGMKPILVALALGLANGFAATAAEAPEPEDLEWSFEGPFGTFDRAALQRGFQVYKEVCASCHSLNHVYYRHLTDIGYNEDQIKAIAATVQVEDGPNDEGEMFMREGKPSDRFKAPFANDAQARMANNGALPPDLSVFAKATPHGADYIHAVLTGYRDAPPEGVTIPEGTFYNEAVAGGAIAMVPPLAEGVVEYQNGTAATVPQMARDVTTFLVWASEPNLEERKRMGRTVVLFLLVLTAFLFALKRKIWSDVH